MFVFNTKLTLKYKLKMTQSLKQYKSISLIYIYLLKDTHMIFLLNKSKFLVS